MDLRPYQVELVDRVRAKMRVSRRVLLQLATGGGKTAIASFIVKSAVQRGGKVWFICHRDFLVEQTEKTFRSAGVECSFIAQGRWFNPWVPVQVAMVNTLSNRIEKLIEQHGAPRVCIWDEAHHISAKTWAKIMLLMPDTIHIGLSATPQRLDGRGLDDHFDDIVCGPSVAWLMEQGFLSQYRMFAPSAPDLAGVHTQAGDYNPAEIDAAMERGVIVGDIVGHYRKLAMGLRAVYFAHNVKRSRELAFAFTEAGIPAQHLDGTASTWERRQAAQMFAAGQLSVLTNVDLFGEGYDLAAQAERDVTIEAVGLCRPTQSLALHLQQLGRSLRPKTQPAVILDHAGNWLRHGLPDDDREWTLLGSKKSVVPEPLQCEECLAILPHNTTICPHCGTVLPVKGRKAGGGKARFVEQRDGDLHEVDRNSRKAMELEELQATGVNDLVAIAKRRGYPDPIGWAGYMWTLQQRRKKSATMGHQQAIDFYGTIRAATNRA